MFCNKCGNEIKEGATFCNKCGAPSLKEDVTNKNSVDAGIQQAKKTLDIKALLIIAMVAVVIITAVIIIVVANNSKNNKAGDSISETTVGDANVELNDVSGYNTNEPKNLTEYDGQIYEDLGLAPAFYNVINATPVIDTRIFKGQYSPSQRYTIFDNDNISAYSQYRTNTYDSFGYYLYETEYSAYEDIYARIIFANDTGLASQTSIDVFEINVGRRMTYPDGVYYVSFDDILLASDNNLSVIYGDNIISHEDLSADYTGMTYSKIVEKFGSIGFVEAIYYRKGWRGIRVTWYCPDDRKILEIEFNPETEEVKETSIVE